MSLLRLATCICMPLEVFALVTATMPFKLLAVSTLFALGLFWIGDAIRRSMP